MVPARKALSAGTRAGRGSDEQGAGMRFGVVGVAHPHAANLTAGLLDAGARCAGYWAGPGSGAVLPGFAARFPELPTVDDPGRLLDDPAVTLVVTADVPDRRAAVAVAAMGRQGRTGREAGLP